MLMKRSLFFVPLMAATLFVAPAPQAAQAGGLGGLGQTVVDLLGNTLLDTLDIVEIGVTAGKGVGLDVRATGLLAAGCSEQEATRYGLGDRGEAKHLFPVFDGPGIFGSNDASSSDKGLTVLGMTAGSNTKDPYELGATIHALGGIDVSVNLRSLLDAVTGLVLIDLEGDNQSYNLPFGGDDAAAE